MKEFEVAVRDAQETEDEPYLEYKYDGQVIRAYQPEPAGYAAYLAGTTKHATEQEYIAATVNFFFGLLHEDSAAFLHEKLMDRKHPFGPEAMLEQIQWMTEEWSARPTGSSSGSTQSPPTTGSGSQPPIPALI